MIKATLKTDAGKPDALLLGLSFQNLARLREGQPIHVNGAEVGLNMDIVVHADKDERAIVESFKNAGLSVPEPR